MRPRISWLLLSAILAVISVGSLLRLPSLVYGYPHESAATSSKVDAALSDYINTLQADMPVRYIVYFSSKPGLHSDSLPLNKDDRRGIIVSNLQETAETSQEAVNSELESLQKTGLITSYNPLWIINAIAVTGSPASIYALAGFSEVNHIALDEPHRYFDDPQNLTSSISLSEAAHSSNNLAWGVARIRADKVWQHLGTSGEDITVGIVDTGVDLNHPDLFDNYRGNLGDGTLTHEKNWFHTTVPTSTAPFDLYGHGTHVAGTAVGQNGIGVAPGAKWIAVSIADEYGIIYDSSVHAAFQWLLAPGGDIAAAPDVINNSWGGAGSRVEFEQDVNILHAAGIIPVFAAGNDGPAPGSVNAPGSYANTIAAGASDDKDQPAWFSGRGPSPLNDEIKPLLLAPGTHTVSAMPGGKYAIHNGTSMATPHVVGSIALLLSADPTMTEADITNTLKDTAVPITITHPNFDSGWGRLDAFAAVLSRQPHGILEGTITDDEQAVEGAQIIVRQQAGLELSMTSEQNGRFYFHLPPGSYDLSISAFGYENIELKNIEISNGQKVTQELVLLRRPLGQISGKVTDEAGANLKARITILGTPLEFSTAADGQFQFVLPIGNYELLAQAAGRRIQRWPLQIAADQEEYFAIKLYPGPSILFLDSGEWRYDSESTYYTDALLDNTLGSDLWSISDPTKTLPTLDDLAPYEIIVWSAPSDSPGRLSLDNTLTSYLDEGGSLLISGQNVASIDGHPGSDNSWFHSYLAAKYKGEFISEGSSPILEGTEETIFSGLSITLNGNDSAGNQISPDLVESKEGTFTEPIFVNENGAAMGLQAGYCEPYRIIHLGFGLEGVNGRHMRAEIMRRSLESLVEPRAQFGVRWLPDQQNELIVPGEQILLDLELQNLSEVITDTFDLEIGSQPWNSSLITETLTLGPCAIGQTSLSIDIPDELAHDLTQDLHVTAVSRSNPQTKANFDLKLKTPGQILLVDDDRFFEAEDAYKTALDEQGLSYDLWETDGQDPKQGSPSPTLLNEYEFVLWFTGYDWYAPITQEENDALYQYLQQGGRLFLSSQDYLFHNQNTPLTQELGIVDYRETVTPTLVYADPALSLSSKLAGPIELNYGSYQNFSDGLIPMEGSLPFLWHNKGMLGGVARTGAKMGRSVFWGLPFETLPVEQQPRALEAVLGWLTDLGDATFVVDQQRTPLTETRYFTLTLRNSNQVLSNLVSITNTLPPGMFIVPGSLDDDVYFSPSSRSITWQDWLAPGEQRQIKYEVWLAETLLSGTQLVNTVTIYDSIQEFAFERSVPLWVDVPDLSQSTLYSVATADLPTRTITYSLILKNTSMAPSENITADLRLPDVLYPLSDTLQTSKGDILFDNHNLIWNGPIDAKELITTTLVLTHTALSESWLPATAVIEEPLTDPIILHELRYLPPYQLFLPIFAAN